MGVTVWVKQLATTLAFAMELQPAREKQSVMAKESALGLVVVMELLRVMEKATARAKELARVNLKIVMEFVLALRDAMKEWTVPAC